MAAALKLATKLLKLVTLLPRSKSQESSKLMSSAVKIKSRVELLYV